jgi:hypothetical protein
MHSSLDAIAGVLRGNIFRLDDREEAAQAQTGKNAEQTTA